MGNTDQNNFLLTLRASLERPEITAPIMEHISILTICLHAANANALDMWMYAQQKKTTGESWSDLTHQLCQLISFLHQKCFRSLQNKGV